MRFKVGGSGYTATRKWVSVKIRPDTSPEADETFTVTLSNAPGGYALGRGAGTGTILDDDPTGGHALGRRAATGTILDDNPAGGLAISMATPRSSKAI